MFTVAWVAFVTVMELTAIPAPKFATVEAWRKFENRLVTATESDCPICALFGAKVEILASGFTVSEAGLELWKAVAADVVPAILTV